MRTFLIVGLCLTVVSAASCSSDEKSGTGPDASSTGGSGTGGGGTGGTSTGGVGTGGGGTGGTSTGGTDAGTGGTDAGTGGVAVDAPAPTCATLQACCGTLTGAFADACNAFVSSNTPTSCVAAEGVFCNGTPVTADGGGTAPTDAAPPVTDGGDAGLGGCNALAACCAALPTQLGQRAKCTALVDNGVNSACDMLIPFLCP